MTNFIDKSGCIVAINMIDLQTGCPWEYDFFEVGGLKHDDDANAYIVDDVNYLIERVGDYLNARGDFAGEQPGKELTDASYAFLSC